MNATLLLCGFCLLLPAQMAVGVDLDKKYSLKLPMLAPIGGRIMPLGQLCGDTIDYLLAVVNKNSDILPDYNVFVDIVDDQCSDAFAVRQTLPVLLDRQAESWVNFSASTNLVPNSPTFSRGTAEALLTPPILLGGICSAVCKSASRLPAQFNTINIAMGCIDPAMLDRKTYPNFYRLMPPATQVSWARIDLLQRFGWRQVAIVSDTQRSSYMDTMYFLEALQSSGFDQIVEEVFSTDNADDAVLRLIAAEARIIFAICYVDTCPAIACSAYKRGLYGPTTVWIFNSIVNLLGDSVILPKGCTSEMTAAVAETSISIGSDTSDELLAKQVSSIGGLTGTDFQKFLLKRYPNIASTPAYGSRVTCFNVIHNTVQILDGLERRLQRNNRTLRDLIIDDTKTVELRELIRDQTLKLDTVDLLARVRFPPNSTEVPGKQMIEQVQKGIRVTVSTYDLGAEKAKRFQDRIPFVWLTANGRPPRSSKLVKDVELKFPSGASITLIVAACVVVILAAVSLAVQIHQRNAPHVCNTFSTANYLTLAGILVLLVPLLIFPTQGDFMVLDAFCKATPPLVLSGFTLFAHPLYVKSWMAYYITTHSKNDVASIKMVKKIAGLLMAIAGCLNGSILIAWYSRGGFPFAGSSMTTSVDKVADTIYHQHLTVCQTASVESAGFLNSLYALNCCYGLMAMIFSLLAKKRVIPLLIDAPRNSVAVAITFPLSVAAVLLNIVSKDFHTSFGIISLFGIFGTACILCVMFFTRLAFYQNVFNKIRSEVSVALADRTSQNASRIVSRVQSRQSLRRTSSSNK